MFYPHSQILRKDGAFLQHYEQQIQSNSTASSCDHMEQLQSVQVR